MAPVATNDRGNRQTVPFSKDVPTIDLERISVRKLLQGDEQAAKTLFHVCCNEGFFYLDLTDDAYGREYLDDANKLYDIARDLFNNVSVEDKTAYKRGDPFKEHLDWGYTSVSMDENGQPDKAEFVNISTYRLLNDPENYPLPSWLSAHTDLYASFMRHGNTIGLAMMKIFEKEMHLQPGQLTDLHQLKDNSGEFLRMFRYPAPKSTNQPRDVPRAPAHTDATSITLLFNWEGGLQITKPTEPGVGKVDLEDVDKEGEEWLYVRPEPGTVIVNLGDPMVVFSNGLLKSGRHQVVTPPGSQGLHHRYSVLTNLRPANDTPMRAFTSDVIPSGDGDEGADVKTALEWSITKVRAILERMTKK